MNDPKGTVAKAATLALTPAATVRDWFNGKDGRPPLFSLTADDQDAAPGGTRRLTPATVLAVCICAALTRLGVPLSRAAVAGLTFAHAATGNPPRSAPGALYGANKATILTVGPGADGEVRILPVGTTDGIRLLATIGAGAVVLPLDSIVERVRNGLAAQPSPVHRKEPASGRPARRG